MQIVSNDGVISAKIHQIVDGASTSYVDSAVISEGAVRAGLSPTSDISGLNKVETLIVHAMTLASDPIFNGEYTAGFDLTKVRFAKIYVVGKETNMGSTTIVEAKDAKQNTLGSFLGGFLVAPCKK